jgi:hypothetical protein
LSSADKPAKSEAIDAAFFFNPLSQEDFELEFI